MRRILLRGGVVLIALVLTGCVVSSGSRGGPTSVAPRTGAVVIGAFNFSESRVLAEIFRQTLNAAGIEAEVLGEVGSREIMEPALEQGQVDLVPEYLGTALTFIDPDAAVTSSGVDAAHLELQSRFRIRGVEVLEPAPGENRNEIVITRDAQQRLGIRSISDLRDIADDLVMGGPPECPSRPLCLGGLEDLYNLHFRQFLPLDVGGPATVAALRSGDVDVGLLFTTNPAIDLYDFVVLRDDLGLQPAENVVPVIRQEVVDRYGDDIVQALGKVTSRLTNKALRALNARAEIDLVAPDRVATEWLEAQGVL